MKSPLQLLLALAALLLLTASLSGCATTESENVSSRPWNAPQGWSGLPSGINEGR